MVDKEWVEYRGQRMIKGWPEKIQAAQVERSFKIDGVEHERVRYGHEEDDWGADNPSLDPHPVDRAIRRRRVRG